MQVRSVMRLLAIAARLWDLQMQISGRVAGLPVHCTTSASGAMTCQHTASRLGFGVEQISNSQQSEQSLE